MSFLEDCLPPDQQKELSNHCRKVLASVPSMPVAPHEMTDTERAIFDIACTFSGTIAYLADHLDPDHRRARQASGL